MTDDWLPLFGVFDRIIGWLGCGFGFGLIFAILLLPLGLPMSPELEALGVLIDYDYAIPIKKLSDRAIAERTVSSFIILQTISPWF